MVCSDKKFWVENLGALFGSVQVVPHTNMTLEEQLNSISRLVLLAAIIMWLFNFKYTAQFLIVSLAFIIIIYYMQRRTMQKCKSENYEIKEYYTPERVVPYTPVSISDRKSYTSGGTKYESVLLNTGEALPFCNDEVSAEPPNNYIASTANQNLATMNGISALPVTKIKPVVVPPAYDLDSWKDNNLVTMSMINSEGSQQDMYLSGYAESTCCGYLPQGTELIPRKRGPPEIREGYSSGRIVSPTPVTETPYLPTVSVREGYSSGQKIRPNQPGWVNVTCGYNPEQVEVGLPSNFPAGNCQQDPVMAQYNKNLFTQTISPGSYMRSEVNEPINSNIGISFTQQFEPVTCMRDANGLHYVQRDPRIIEPEIETPSESIAAKAGYDNVYDPRFYGYGTSYRSYLEPVTGQTRFMYDDVNAIRMPNYITRSKVDFLPYADTYGSMEPGAEFGNPLNSDIRALAQDSWMRDSFQFRDDLQQRLMRKVNAEAWQKRMYPNSSRPVGSSAVFRR